LPENKAEAPLIRGQRPLGLTKGVNGAYGGEWGIWGRMGQSL